MRWNMKCEMWSWTGIRHVVVAFLESVDGGNMRKRMEGTIQLASDCASLPCDQYLKHENIDCKSFHFKIADL